MAANHGEVLFTEYGVSGPAIFDISRTVSTGGEGLVCALDFFPDWETREVLDWLRLRRETMGAHEASTLLVGSCHTRLGQMLWQSRRVHQPARRRPHRQRSGAYRPAGEALCAPHHRHLRL